MDGTPKEGKNPARSPSFDAASYENLIENHVIPEIKNRVQDDKWLFMQDNASIHCVKRDGETLTNIQKIFRAEGVELVKLPPLSPDLTPIENCFSLLAKEYSKLFDELPTNAYPKTKAQNFEYIKIAWANVDNDMVKKIYFTFTNRLHKVKAANGLNNINL